LYYGVIGVIGVTSDWRDFGRVIAGLLLGVFIYELTIIATDFLASVNPLSLTIIEITGLTLPLVICIFPPTNSQITHFILLCFFMSLLPLLSQLSLSSKIKGNCITNYLGKLSMPIYIMHKCVEQTIILSFGSSDNTTPPTKKVSIAIYFLGSIILAMVTMRLVNKCKWAQKLDAKQK
jgi:peptidoglycan/LPS O-acetylase OafA/YrhL